MRLLTCLPIRAALFTIFLSAALCAQERDVTRYLRSIEIEAGRNVEQVFCFGCSVKVSGSVTEDVIAIGGDIEISGTVAGDVIAVGGRITVRPKGTIHGEAVTIGGALVRDALSSAGPDADELPYFHLPEQRSLSFRGVVTILCANLILALLGGALLRFRRLQNIAASVRHHSAWCFVAGLVLLAVWALLFALLDYVTRGGVEVFLWVVQGLLALVLICGCAGLTWLAGSLVLPKAPGIVRLALGALIWTALLLVPLAGALVFVVAVVLALGAASRSRFGFR